MIKTVRKYFDVCQRCGGASGPEVANGDTVILYLTDTDVNLPATLEAIVVNIEPGSSTDTVGRYYTFQYDNATLLPDNTEISACDITGALCQSCCVLLQAQIDAIRSTSKPYVSLAYKWQADDTTLPFRKATLIAYAFPALPDATIVSYQFYKNNGTEIMSVDVTNSFIDIPDSLLPLYFGGEYYVIATDSAGRTGRADVHVVMDDTLYELAKIRRNETELGVEDQVDRATAQRPVGSADFYTGSMHTANFWGRELNLWGIGFQTSNSQPVVRITQHHLLVHSEATPILGTTYDFKDRDNVTHTVTCADSRAVGPSGLRVVAFTEEVDLADIPQVDFLPRAHPDWLNIVTMNGAAVGVLKVLGNLEITSFTNDQLDCTLEGVGYGYYPDISDDTGNPLLIFVDAAPVLVGWRVSDVTKLAFTWEGALIAEIKAMIAEMALCPPHLEADITTVRFWHSVDWFNVRRRPFIWTDKNKGVAVGEDALAGQYGASAYNIGIGREAGNSVTTGTENVVIGAFADVQTGTDSNSTVIGYGATGLGSDRTVIGNEDVEETYLRGALVLGSNNPKRGLFDFTGTGAGGYISDDGNTLMLTAETFTFFAEHANGALRFQTGNTGDAIHTVIMSEAGDFSVGLAVPDPAYRFAVQADTVLWGITADGAALTSNGTVNSIGNTGAASVFDVKAASNVRAVANNLVVAQFKAAQEAIFTTPTGDWRFHQPAANVNRLDVAGASVLLNTTDVTALLGLAVAGTTRLRVSDAAGVGLITLFGDVSINDATAVRKVNCGTTNGVQFGNAVDKLGFFGATPRIQPESNTTSGVASPGAGNVVREDTLFDGSFGSEQYTIGGLIQELKSLGILKQ